MLTTSERAQLKRLAEYGKPVHPTACGIELDRGEFWGRRADMQALEKLGLVESKLVMHGPRPVPHYTVSAAGHVYLSTLAN